MEYVVEFGLLCDPIKQQLERQGMTISDSDAESIQSLSDAILLLRVQGIMIETEADKAEKRLMKKIKKVIRV